MIQAGLPEEVSPNSGEWLFVDVGFSSNGRSCGVLGHDDAAIYLTFGQTLNRIIAAGSREAPTLNLLIEAPLSVAFNANGNPTGRSFERQGSQHRYWYEGLGCLVMTAAMFLLRGLCDSKPSREIHLFEGFVSFKPKGQPTSHSGDVEALRAVVFDRCRDSSTVVAAAQFACAASDKLYSAFSVAGMDFGLPPVVRPMSPLRLQTAAVGGIKGRRG